jgi:hypothetical protein
MIGKVSKFAGLGFFSVNDNFEFILPEFIY